MILTSVDQAGAALRRLRRAANLTQAQLADKVQMRQATISGMERGDPGFKWSNFFAVLAALDLELDIRPRGKAKAADFAEHF